MEDCFVLLTLLLQFSELCRERIAQKPVRFVHDQHLRLHAEFCANFDESSWCSDKDVAAVVEVFELGAHLVSTNCNPNANFTFRRQDVNCVEGLDRVFAIWTEDYD